MMTILIPAAGFGKRNSDFAIKELMLFQGKPLIEYSFDHLMQAHADKAIIKKTIVITRQEKLAGFQAWLKEYRQKCSHALTVRFQVIEPEGEWPSTLLKSAPYWSDKNLVLLPDTRITASWPFVKTLAAHLDKASSVWGVVEKPLDLTGTFGVIERKGARALAVCEKPRVARSPWVWGCFAFQKKWGEAVLNILAESCSTHSKSPLPENSLVLDLNFFEDLSRSPQ